MCSQGTVLLGHGSKADMGFHVAGSGEDPSDHPHQMASMIRISLARVSLLQNRLSVPWEILHTPLHAHPWLGDLHRPLDDQITITDHLFNSTIRRYCSIPELIQKSYPGLFVPALDDPLS